MFISQFLKKSLPRKIIKPIIRWNTLLFLFCIIQLIGWYFALFHIGSDTDQGNVYRIIFVHVPIAWCAFFWFFFSAFFSILSLINSKKISLFDRSASTAMELAVLFSFLVLITGSLWGKPTWGIWWDWDPRLTSSLVLFLMGCGYLMLRYFTPNQQTRQKVSAFIAILSALNVPIAYFSVNLWRSVHQPQTFVKSATSASKDIIFVLFFNFIATFLLSIAIYKIKRQAKAAIETLEEFREGS